MTLETYLAEHWRWSQEVNGPPNIKRTLGILQHIQKEIEEIKAEPTDLEEWVDVITLACDGFMRHGGSVEELLPAMYAKLQKNKKRSWPKNVPEDQAIEHIR